MDKCEMLVSEDKHCICRFPSNQIFTVSITWVAIALSHKTHNILGGKKDLQHTVNVPPFLLFLSQWIF